MCVVECSDTIAYQMSCTTAVKKANEEYINRDEFLAVIEGMLSKEHKLYKELKGEKND